MNEESIWDKQIRDSCLKSPGWGVIEYFPSLNNSTVTITIHGNGLQ